MYFAMIIFKKMFYFKATLHPPNPPSLHYTGSVLFISFFSTERSSFLPILHTICLGKLHALPSLCVQGYVTCISQEANGGQCMSFT